MKLKGKKLFASIIMAVMALCVLFNQNASYAAGNGFWGDMQEARPYTNTAYSIGDPNEEGSHRIGAIVAYSGETGSTTIDKKLYCVKAGTGETWTNETDPARRRVNYTQDYNLKIEKTKISQIPDSSPAIYKEIVTGNYYNQILWIIDNMYIPGTGEKRSTTTDRAALLSAAGIDDSFPADVQLTDDDIEAVQQLALWYYTNHGEDIFVGRENNKFNVISNALRIKNGVTNNLWKTLHSIVNNNYGDYKEEQMNLLLCYLIDSAEANASKYTANNELEKPITITGGNIAVTDLDTNTNNYKVGPITITKNNDLLYTIDTTVKNASGAQVSGVSYINADGSSIDINNLASTENQVYLKVPKSAGDKLSIDLDVNYKTSQAILWTPAANHSKVEQPIIEVDKVKNNEKFNFSTQKSVFDMALRKYISGISSSNNITDADRFDTRVPSVDVTPLKNGTATTANYTHPKKPRKVQNGDYIEYTIRVYNEGEKAGYVEEITDYILNNQGLQYVPDNSVNTDYGWKMYDSNNRVTTDVTKAVKIKTDYLSKAKGETANLITAFDETKNTLDSRDVKIVFKVTESNSSKNTLVNIAEITKEIDVDGKEMKVKGEDDRDSVPGSDEFNYPNNGYDESHKHEDDIDFEPVVLKQFDLALRKFITAIAPQGDMSKMYDVESRVPQLDGSWGTGKDATTLKKEHSKNPLPVKQGDYVLYTIRVYNEGEVDGYASIIRDNFHEGLEFINSQDEAIKKYNGIWTIDSKARNITTDWLGKGKGLEYGTTEGDANYTANLIKALQKDENGNVQVSTTEGALNPDYRDVQVLLKVTETNESSNILYNYAQIDEDSDENGNPVEDIDSHPGEWINGEDDQDYDPVILQSFDLALRKFISKVDGVELATSRAPEVKPQALVDGTKTTADYEHTKEPLKVNKNSKITYELRVYNEGDIDGYASEIKDYLPEYLEMVPVSESTTNASYGWEISNDGRVATTKYLAPKENETATNTTVIKARDGEKLSYKPVEIECRIKDGAVPEKYITNIAEISEYRQYISATEKPVINPDRDSNSNSLTDGNSETGTLPSDADLPDYKKDEIESGKKYIPGQEDDDDFEKIYFSEPEYDLALRKFITKVNGKEVDTRAPAIKMDGPQAVWGNDNGTTATKEHTKAPVAVTTGDIITYTIRVYNEGDVTGTAKEITDYLPSGLEFIEDSDINKNYKWTAEGKVVKTDYLKDSQIRAVGDTGGMETGLFGIPYYLDVEIECRVTADKITSNNLRNIAAITEDDGDDRDSSPDENPSNDNYNPKAPESGEGEQDDDDFEDLVLKPFDLSLRKFITNVDGKPVADREPQVDITKLADGTATTAIYNHAKQPLAVKKGSTVIYTIRVYNEGQANGYASRVTDYLPEYLEFVEGSTINQQYGWKQEENGAYTTEFLASDDKMLKAFDGTTLDSQDLLIECKVKETAVISTKITNIAEISGYKNENKIIVNPDRDSTSSNIKMPEDLPGYKDNEIASGEKYIPGQEDDDDFEKIYVPKFDLALRKFITNISGTEETSRIPQVDASKLVSGESTTATYTHPKDPIKIMTSDIITYTIRVYNEGEIDGYAAEVADDIPEYLTFLPDNTVNTTYGWKMYDEAGNETSDVSKAVQIKTTYLSKENEKTAGENLIKAFDPTKEVSDTNPSYKDVKVAFQVSDNAPASHVITNKAQVVKNTDENGDPIDDIDSTPGKWIDGEDDQDVENIIPQVFDLGLLKYVSQVQVTEDGKTRTTNTNNVGNHQTDIVPKVEIHKKKINTTTVKFVYTIKVTNIGDVAGNAKQILDYIPEGMEFVAADNPQWKAQGDGVVATDALVNTRLQPGESATVAITLKWVNGANNMGLKRNVAQMEDDKDYADILISIRTGKVVTYILLIGTVLVVLASGITLIRKYVL